jgi:hypothetical protein
VNTDLESRLRDALGPVTPRDELTRKLLAGVVGEPAPTAPGTRVAAPRSRARRLAMRWWPVGLAAALVVGIGVQQHLQRVHEREAGQLARRQVIEALRLTSEKLDLAYRTVRAQGSS